MFDGTSTLMVHLMLNPFLYNVSDTIQPTAGVIGEFNTCPWGIGPKVNMITRPNLEVAYFEAAIQHFSHYTTWRVKEKMSAMSAINTGTILAIEDPQDDHLSDGGHQIKIKKRRS